jgi:hypothetical protein
VLPAAILVLAAAASAESPNDSSVPHSRDNASGPSSSAPIGAVLTGKERWGDKASDDQRIDNCNVPATKRGTKPRPDSCDHQNTNMRSQ